MIPPKLLSSDDRRRIEQLLNQEWGMTESVLLLIRALAAERYWREAVKTAAPLHYFLRDDEDTIDETYLQCLWCDQQWHGPEDDQHRPDCVWLLAQERLLAQET